MAGLFSTAAIRESVFKSVDEATAAIPPGRHTAVIIDATKDASGTSASALLVHRVGDTWAVVTEAQYDGHRVAGKVSVAGSW